MEELSSYDKDSVESIIAHANRLTGNTLREVAEVDIPELKKAGKGNLGILVERLHFRHSPPNDHNPDFSEAGLELKSTGVRRDPGVPGGYKAKERLVLNLINYHDLAKESWQTSSLLHKSGLLLLLFYLFEEKIDPLDRQFVLPPLLLENLSKFQSDFLQIKDDWHQIQQKVLEGKAHELSESDTRLLGACTKSSDSTKFTSQPFSKIPAKPRAFSLKQGYLTFLMTSQEDGYVSIRQKQKVTRAPQRQMLEEQEQISHINQDANTEPLAAPSLANLVPIETLVRDKFEPYLGLPESEIAEVLGFPSSIKKNKAYLRLLVNRVLVDGEGVPLELVKEGVQVKTVRLEANGKPREHMSFPHFNYKEVNSQEWADSDFANQIEQKFLFVVFERQSADQFILTKIQFWSMPAIDREEAERVWLAAKRAIDLGEYQNLPKSTGSKIAHVRPHARNRLDTLPTPQGGEEVKRCFWLHRNYIGKIVSPG
ncbi:MAG: hypothetical protein RL228_1251 [Actinomycetota bacterium]